MRDSELIRQLQDLDPRVQITVNGTSDIQLAYYDIVLHDAGTGMHYHLEFDEK